MGRYLRSTGVGIGSGTVSTNPVPRDPKPFRSISIPIATPTLILVRERQLVRRSPTESMIRPGAKAEGSPLKFYYSLILSTDKTKFSYIAE